MHFLIVQIGKIAGMQKLLVMYETIQVYAFCPGRNVLQITSRVYFIYLNKVLSFFLKQLL